MLRDYQVVSPSLEGVLSDSVLMYEGIRRPTEVLRVLDGPSSKGRRGDESSYVKGDPVEHGKVLEQYFNDLYGVFMKKLSYFVVAADSSVEETVKLQAMLQEMVKVKVLLQHLK